MSHAALGDTRWTSVRIARRGGGMSFVAAGLWAATAAVAVFAGLDAGPLALVFVVGGALVYPAGYLLNRAFGGDLRARGSALRGMVGAITVGQALGWPLLAALRLREVRLVAFALAGMLDAQFLSYGWLYRAPAYYVLGVASVVVGAALQALIPASANMAIPLAMCVLCLACAASAHRQSRREVAAC